MVYYNKVVPLPLSLSDIRQRVTEGYYRQVEGVRHDVLTIANNAVLFNKPESDAAALAEGERDGCSGLWEPHVSRSAQAVTTGGFLQQFDYGRIFWSTLLSTHWPRNFTLARLMHGYEVYHVGSCSRHSAGEPRTR